MTKRVHIGARALNKMTVDERFAAFTRQEGECLVWTGNRNHHGYGRVMISRKDILAHRLAYERAKGSIPDGLVIDHLCRNTLCVNPDHLEAVTHRENILRGMGPSAQFARRTHCLHGHPLSGDNLKLERVHGGRRTKRTCRICYRAKKNRQDAQRKELTT